MSETPSPSVAALADRLFGAIETSDIATVEELFSPDITVVNSGNDTPNDHDRAVRTITWFVNATVERRYEILDRQLFDSGFVQQHVLHATGRMGTSIAMRACIAIKLDDEGLIRRIDEYFDPAEMSPLLAERRT